MTTMNYETLDEKQKEAVAKCCDMSIRLMAVTGQAGTGKTTIIRVSYDALVEHGYRVALAAPTGKAAKRIYEATGIRAMTVHRLLEFTHPGEKDPETGKVHTASYPRKDRENPLSYDVVIVDEYAMVPTALHRQIIDALPTNGKLRAFGDINQLPPVDDGDRESPFSYLLRQAEFPCVVLTTIHRHGGGSAIVKNGALILKGMVPVSNKDGGFTVTVTDNPLAKLANTLTTIASRGDRLFDKTNYQIITPQRTGKAGTYALNQRLIDMFPCDGDSVSVDRYPWEVKKGLPAVSKFVVGQKVIIVKNLYDLRPHIDDRFVNDKWVPPQDHEMVFNGESGVIVAVQDEDITIDLGDRNVTIPAYLEYLDDKGRIKVTDPRKEIEHGYAITTHKAQGSEYEGVIYFITSQSAFAQCRSNFYTGITRAKNQVAVIGDRWSVTRYSLKEKSGFEKK